MEEEKGQKKKTDQPADLKELMKICLHLSFRVDKSAQQAGIISGEGSCFYVECA
jgi:hypothetical protein